MSSGVCKEISQSIEVVLRRKCNHTFRENPISTRKPGGFMQSCIFPCIVKFLVHLLQYLKDTINIIPQTTTKYVVLYENWVTQIWKIVIQLDSTNQYENFDMQHAYVMIKIKEVMSNPIFLSFTACSHSNFLWLLFRYIHLICTCLSMHNMLI